MTEHGRLIDADALIADCQLAQKQADGYGREFSNAFYSGSGEISTEWWCVEDLIENAPTIEPQQKWIPCGERLPEERDAGILKKLGTSKRSDYVLITVDVKGERMASVGCTHDGIWNWDKKYAFPNYKVIAWMPLPEPYKESNGWTTTKEMSGWIKEESK